MSRPLEMAARLGWYILKTKVSGRKRFPLVTMLEPLEKCNLACEGCGRIREYEPVLDRVASVEQCLCRSQFNTAPKLRDPFAHTAQAETLLVCSDRCFEEAAFTRCARRPTART